MHHCARWISNRKTRVLSTTEVVGYELCRKMTMKVVFQCPFNFAVKSEFVFHRYKPTKWAESSSINITAHTQTSVIHCSQSVWPLADTYPLTGFWYRWESYDVRNNFLHRITGFWDFVHRPVFYRTMDKVRKPSNSECYTPCNYKF
jgi:hypothetical protein